MLSNLFKTFQYLMGFDGKCAAAGSSNTAAILWCVRKCARVFMCLLIFSFVTGLTMLSNLESHKTNNKKTTKNYYLYSFQV